MPGAPCPARHPARDRTQRGADHRPLPRQRAVRSGKAGDRLGQHRRHTRSLRSAARVVHQDWLGFGPQRNFGSTQASHDWILALDADEALSSELAEEMQRRLPQLMQSQCAGAILRRQTWYMGAPMRWYRPMMGERLGRLYHRGRARWTDVRVHESLRFDGPTKRSPDRSFT